MSEPRVTPLREPEPAPRPSPAEAARAIVAARSAGALATLTADGAPWASRVSYGELADGAPVLLVSSLAEHGRNLRRDARASLLVALEDAAGDPLDAGRVTLAGHVEVPAGAEADAARAAFLAAAESAHRYVDFADFSLFVLRVERVRWVGGFARMGTVDGGDYRTAAPDPVAGSAASAVRHLNEDHADALLAMAAGPAGFTDATAAVCRGADRYGLDLWVTTPRGSAAARVGFAAPCTRRDGLRAATVELARRARALAAITPVAGTRGSLH